MAEEAFCDVCNLIVPKKEAEELVHGEWVCNKCLGGEE